MAQPGHEGTPYDVLAADSLLTVIVYRAGPLARAGHNHVIASRDLAGSLYVPADPLRTTFEIHVPVEGFSVDEPELRAREGADFPADVPQSAREGTQHNMLGEALLDAARYPEIVLRSVRIATDTQPGQVQAQIAMRVREQEHIVTVPLHYDLQGGRLSLDGQMPLRQSELGLTPFSALMGALQVQDEMLVRYHIVARRAPGQ